jgi:hypothetical protein
MLNDSNNKSSRAAGDSPEPRRGTTLPTYLWLGVAVLAVGEILMIMRVPLATQWFTPIMWTGYILVVDALIRWRKGTSLLSDYPREFWILAVISIGSWAIFEGYNVLLKNWVYIGLPDNMVVRYIGYAWAFATISPVMFLTYELLDVVVPGENPPLGSRLGNGVFWSFVVFGFACLVVPLIWPSTWMTPLVWIGFAFFLDPINGRLGDRSFLSEFFTGRYRSMLLMFLGGFICGIFWEFWNYWATTKWEYYVPYVGHIKLFEMPVLGFLGFMPFAVESYAIYIFVRRLLPIKRPVKYLG